MGWLSRRPSSSAAEIDPSLPPLTVDQAALLRRTVHAWLAQHGHEALVAADHVELESTFGLENLARNCAQHPQRSWGGLVGNHLQVLMTATTTGRVDPAMLPRAELLSRVMLRLWPSDTFDTDSVGGPSIHEVADGLVETLVYDAPSYVATIDAERETKLGSAELRGAARRNLARDRYVHEIVEQKGARIDLVHSESTYAASKILVLTDLLRELYGERDFSRGVLVGVPDRSMLVLHVVEGQPAHGAIASMTPFVTRRYAEAPWPLSPHIYWWNAGELVAVARADGLDANGQPKITVIMDDDFGAATGLLVPRAELTADRLGVTLEPGDRVAHSGYGPGAVMAVYGVGNDRQVKVAFDGHAGVQLLSLRFVSLERLAG
jgi:surface antigen